MTQFANGAQLDQENYRAIRAEYTQVFNSFRTLVGGQLAGIILICDKLFDPRNMNSLLGISLAFIVMVTLVTIIGHNWFSQAVYLSSYLFVVYEYPEEEQNKTEAKDRRYQWILANRAKKFVPNKSNWFDKYYAGQELSLFHSLQIIIAGCIFMITNFLLIRDHKISVTFDDGLLTLAFAATGTLILTLFIVVERRFVLKLAIVIGVALLYYFILEPEVKENSYYLVFVEAAMIVTIVITVFFHEKSRTLISRATAHWIAYTGNRVAKDNEYLAELKSGKVQSGARSAGRAKPTTPEVK
jgi:hypothetical protein